MLIPDIATGEWVDDGRPWPTPRPEEEGDEEGEVEDDGDKDRAGQP